MHDDNQSETNETKNEGEIEELIWKSQLGEVRALEDLLKIYEKLILRVSRRYYFQDGDTEDVIQECKIAFWQSIMTYKRMNPSISLESFAYICINRKLASALRKRTKQNTKLHNSALARDFSFKMEKSNYEKDLLISKEDIEKEFIFKESRNKYYDKITSDVSIECAQILKMREAGYSYREIGEELNISVKKIDNTLAKIRKNSDIKNMLN